MMLPKVVMSIQQARSEIAKLAGVKASWKKSEDIGVFFTPVHNKPPTLQDVHPKNLRNLKVSRGAQHGRTRRRVVVGKLWLTQHAPELWAVIVGARLLGSDRQLVSWSDHGVTSAFIIPTLTFD